MLSTLQARRFTWNNQIVGGFIRLAFLYVPRETIYRVILSTFVSRGTSLRFSLVFRPDYCWVCGIFARFMVAWFVLSPCFFISLRLWITWPVFGCLFSVFLLVFLLICIRNSAYESFLLDVSYIMTFLSRHTCAFFSFYILAFLALYLGFSLFFRFCYMRKRIV